jgi:nitroreductase
MILLEESPAMIDLILSRRSARRLTGPELTDQQLQTLFACAAAAPDHGRLRPWRLIALQGEARQQLGDTLAQAARSLDPDVGPDKLDRVRRGPSRAPTLLTVVFSPKTAEKITEWEQLAAASCAVQNVCLAAHSLGMGAIWRTGHIVDHSLVRKHFALYGNERLLGWIYLGWPVGGDSPQTKTSWDDVSRFQIYRSTKAVSG